MSYVSNVQITLRSAVLAGWLVDRMARDIASIAFHYTGVVARALTSRRAMQYYRNVFDTVVWLGKAAIVAGQIARILVAIALTWLDAKVEESLEPVELEEHYQPIITDTVIPFQRPYRKPVCEPIDWSQWGLRDLRKASQRSGFGIPADCNGKSLTKPQFVTLYEQALEEAASAIAA